MITDPISDMLTRIRNGIHGGKEVVEIPSSKLKVAVLKILKKEGFIASLDAISDNNQKNKILVTLRYGAKKEPMITSLKRVSRPGKRVYLSYKEIKPVLGGMGISVLSTSKGLMTDSEAKENKLGGEILCTIW